MINQFTFIREADRKISNNNSLLFLSQSDDTLVRNTNKSNSVQCDTLGVTCFVEDESMVSRPVTHYGPSTSIERYSESIAEFMKRPQLIVSTSLNTTQPEGTNLFTSQLGPLLNSVTLWSNKVDGYGLVKGTCVVRFEVNAMRFHSGTLLAHYIPNASSIEQVEKRFNANLVQKMQHPGILFGVDRTMATLKIPYIAPDNYYQLEPNGDLFTADWGTVYLDVFTPLRVGTGNTSIGIQVYVYWEDLEFAAPMVAQSDGRMVKARTEDSASGERISTTLASLSTNLHKLGGVPMIGNYISSLGWAARATSAVAAAFGYSKTDSGVTHTIVAPQANRYLGVSEGTDTSIPLGVSYDNKLKITDSYTLTGEDEMSYSYLLQKIPNYVSTIEWSTNAATGQALLSRDISPISFGVLDHVSGTTHTTVYSTGGPLYYLGNVHALYRGSIILHLKIANTSFHSGSLSITFTPTTTFGVAPTLGDGRALRQIVDIRDQSEVHLVLPYMLPKNYIEVLTKLPGGTAFQPYIGSLQIRVINPLVTSGAASDIIDIIEYYTAGEDFEFAMPCSPQYETGYGLPFFAQSDDTLVNKGIADTKVQSMRIEHSELSVGEKLTSIKQLLSRLSFGINQFGWSATKNVEVFPWYVGMTSTNATTGAVVRGNVVADAIGYFAPMYLYMRGAVRIYQVLAESPSTYQPSFAALKRIDRKDVYYFVTSTNDYAGGRNVATTLGSASRQLTINSIAPVSNGDITPYFKVPYIAKTPVSIINPDVSSQGVVASDFMPSTSLVLSHSSANPGSAGYGRSAADDFQLSMFIACPSLLLSSVPN